MELHTSLTTGLLFLYLHFLNVIRADFCFKKVHGSHPSDPSRTVCRGLIDKSFPSLRACCEKDNAAAYHSELIPLGKRKKKWECIACPAVTDVIHDQFVKVEGAGWSEWGEWSACSKTCSIGSKTRQRICQDTNSSNCDGVSTLKMSCIDAMDCPVDGVWGPWSTWSECTKTCSGGVTERFRQCNNPAPKFGGKRCAGNRTETLPCNEQGCPVDGGWSAWVYDSSCSVTCGKGTLTVRRQCDSPSPQYGGRNCSGPEVKTQKCDAGILCPIHGQWSLWSRFTSCSGSCGKGSRQRFRACVAPKPLHGGRDCVGNSIDNQVCYSHSPCPIDGGWSRWSSWGICLARPCSNSSGLQTRSRTCSSPLPRFKGKLCDGATTQTQQCYFNENCPVHGQWCEWQPFSECRKGENNINFQIRTRDCTCPFPKHGGNTCIGDDYQLNRCQISRDNKESPQRCNSLPTEGSGIFDDEDNSC
ncbi:hypothetical protein EB796_006562 [Bugula neritina]|uniref:Uncharacterized protein n=1 Tax=Bugula neritina TaxID=10212 RepID=A0A7J7K929_BUGNE|nr:hypothetical protein EB796_006562 [Bugula neritina]